MFKKMMSSPIKMVLVLFLLIIVIAIMGEGDTNSRGGCYVNVKSAELGKTDDLKDEYSDSEFVYQTFVEIAVNRGWTKNAITGTLAYIMQEGGGQGSFTYESYWTSPGPSGQAYDKTLDNQKWLNWLASSSAQNWYFNDYRKQEARCNCGRADWAIGLGLMQWSDVAGGTRNATKLIEEAEERGVYWQDLGFQLEYLMEQVENSNDRDLIDVDPSVDSLSGDEWARRVTAGIGMPGWSWNGGNAGLDSHAIHVPRAEIFAEGKSDVDLSTLGLKSKCSSVGRIKTKVDGALDFEEYAKPNGEITPPDESKKLWHHIGLMREKSDNDFKSVDRYQCTEFAQYCFYTHYGKAWLHGNGIQMANNLITEHSDEFYNAGHVPVAGSVVSTSGISSAGHVLFIHQVRKDGTVVISDGNVLGAGGIAGTETTGIRIMREVNWDTFLSEHSIVIVAAPNKAIKDY